MKVARLLAALVATIVFAAQASAGTISTAGVATTLIGTSHDSIALIANNQTLAFTDTPTLFNLQTANFGLQYSTAETDAFVLNENVTINGVTHSVAFNFTDFITDPSDTLVLAQGAAMQFGTVSFQLMGTSINTNSLGDHFFTVQAKISDVPEPASLAIFGLGLLGFAAARRKSVK
jgi:hypothetical protein